MMTAIFQGVPPCVPPHDLLDSAIATGDTEPLAYWFTQQTNPGYGFATIVEFIEATRQEVEQC